MILSFCGSSPFFFLKDQSFFINKILRQNFSTSLVILLLMNLVENIKKEK